MLTRLPWLILLLLMGLLSGTALRAQTAGDLLASSTVSFNAGDYVAAEKSLTRFLEDYGRSAEAKDQIEPVLRLLGVCQIQLGKFEDALATVERYLKEFPTGAKAEDFSFWAGVAHLRLDDPVKAQAAFQAFLKKHPSSARAEDARFSFGLALLKEDKFKETAAYFEAPTPPFRADMAWQAGVIRLYALIESAQWEPALRQLGAVDPHDASASRIATYHLLALDLGNKLMEQEQYRPALSALQRVWSKTRITARQQGRLEALRTEIQRLGQARGAAENYELTRKRELAAQIEQELVRLEKMADYDTALQFRIAQCFFRLERPREAFLVLTQMVERLPDSDLLAQADYTRLLCLTRMERWAEAVEVAAAFEKRFAAHQDLPAVLYLKAESQQRLGDHAGAFATFTAITGKFPQFPQAPRCDFLAGHALLLQEKNEEAAAHFEAILQRNAPGAFIEPSRYWLAMAWHFHKDYPKSRGLFGAYLKAHPKGPHAADAAFRRAQGLFNQKQFAEAYKELEAFLKEHPGSAPFDEACNLLGDCYLALGEIDRGLAAYRRVSGRDGKLYDYGIFRTGQAIKALEDFPGMRAHFEQFLKDRPQSPRFTEALAQIAWVHRRLDEPEKAKEVYWNALRTHGNDPEAAAVEDMLRTLARMHKTPEEQTRLQARLSDLAEAAAADSQSTLAARAWWARASLIEKTEPERAREFRLRAAAAAEPRQHSAALLADLGDVLRQTGKAAEAETFYRTILSWYPRSLLKDRAYAGLGLLAQEAGQEKAALDHFARFERETTGSPLLDDVLRARADLLAARGDLDGAVRDLERILELPAAKGRPWAEALYRIGEIRLRQNDPKRAIPYFQRIYVMYGRWTDVVAKAYWQSGQAFEKLDMAEEARKTYQEFTGQDHLRQTPEFSKALERLQQTGGA
jgi:TolA-binding protein